MLNGRLLLVLLAWLFLLEFSYAQKGDYFVKRFVVEEERIDNPYFSIIQSQEGYILVSNRSGILQFDGYRWERIPCPGAVYSMDKSNGDFIVAGKFGFGYIDHQETFISLSDSLESASNTYSCKLFLGHGIYQTDSVLYAFDLETYTLQNKIALENDIFMYLINYESTVLAVTYSGKVYEVTNQFELKEYNKFQDIRGRPVFIEKFGNQTIVGSNFNDLYIIEDNVVRKIKLDDDGYLNENIITSAQWLNEKLVAIGTLKGGIAFIDPTSGKLDQIVNSHTGLSDNEVLGMAMDQDQGLWVTENNGLDRVAPFLPIRNFSNYPGLNGRVISIYPDDNNELYVSTTLGVYNLTEVKDFEEIIKLIKTPYLSEGQKLTSKKQQQEEKLTNSDEEVDTVKKRRLFSFRNKKTVTKNDKKNSNKGFFTRIFGKDQEVINDSSVVEEKVFQELKSIRYVFQRVDGIDSKNSLFEKRNGDLINAGLSGIYQIIADSSIMISKEPVRDIMITKGNLLLAATVNGNVLIFEKSNYRWQLLEDIADLNDEINYLYEDQAGVVWMTGNYNIFKIVQEDGNYIIQDYPLINPYSDKTLVVEINDKIYFINPTGYYFYDNETGSIVHDSTLFNTVGKPIKYFGFDQKSSWIYNGEFWHGFNNVENGDELNKVVILSLIRNIKYISYDESRDLYWVITNDDLIYSVSNLSDHLSSNYNLKLKEVSQPNTTIETSGKILKLNEVNGNVTFEYVLPDYSGVLGIKYRYKLVGLDNDWTDWSENNVIKFPYLPPGKYEIIVQSRDIFGQVNESIPLAFNIIPPYWEQPWFYALEILIFSFLLFISIKLNRKPNARYMMFNRLLAFLTLILIVEYVQAIGEAKFGDSSPVLGFFIQVVIAAAVLPLEQIMRKWLIGETRVREILKDNILSGEETDKNKD